MIRVRVTENSSRQLGKLKEALGADDTSSVLRFVPTTAFQERVLQHLKDLTPVSEHTDERWARGYVPQGVSEKHMADQWRSAREYSGNQLSIRFYSLLETIGGKRGEAKLASVELGTRRMTIKAPRTFRFKGDYTWLQYEESEAMKRPARKGQKIVARTQTFIEEQLLPAIRLRSTELLKAKLQRYS